MTTQSPPSGYFNLHEDTRVLVQFLDAHPDIEGSQPDEYPSNVWGRADMSRFLPDDIEEGSKVRTAIRSLIPIETYHVAYPPRTVRLLVCPMPLPAVCRLMDFFAYSHLPPALQVRSKPFHELALRLGFGPQNEETVAALRKLLEAKDCAVRAWLS